MAMNLPPGYTATPYEPPHRFLGLNWKLMWACFFAGAALFCLVGALVGAGAAVAGLVICGLFSVGLVVWNWTAKPEGNS